MTLRSRADLLDEVSSPKEKPIQGRGPAYPNIAIDKAIGLAEALKKSEGFYAVPRESVFKAWGMGEKSSGARQALAAMKYFGLVEYIGSGETLKVKLSDVARRIILDIRPESTERFALIRDAALSPNIHQELQHEYPNGLPSDATLQSFLTLKKNFNEAGAKDLIAQYRRTLQYLEEIRPSGMAAMPEESLPDSPVPPPLEQKVEPAPEVPAAPKFAQKDGPPPVGMRREVFTVDEGEVAITFPEVLSADSVEDMKGHFALILRKAARRAGVSDNLRRQEADDVG